MPAGRRARPPASPLRRRRSAARTPSEGGVPERSGGRVSDTGRDHGDRPCNFERTYQRSTGARGAFSIWISGWGYGGGAPVVSPEQSEGGDGVKKKEIWILVFFLRVLFQAFSY